MGRRIIFKCPRTGMNVQHWLDDVPERCREDAYKSVTWIEPRPVPPVRFAPISTPAGGTFSLCAILDSSDGTKMRLPHHLDGYS